MVGRFTSVDPIKSGLNWYSYCDNNPVTRTDKTGEAWETIFDLLSLGGSIAEVCANPDDLWAWGGLVGDALDVAVPFLGGIGETIRALKYANKVMDVADDIIDAGDAIHDVAKAADRIEDAADTIHDASRAADKIEDSVKATSEIAEESTSKVLQKHHYATNKSKTYTHQFEEIVGKYKLDLDGDWNKEVLPHHGRHPNAYHEFVLEQVTEIDSIAGGNAKKFLDLFESNVKRVIRDNPDMLYKQYWRNLK